MKTAIRALMCVGAIACSGVTGCVLGVPGVHDVTVAAVDIVNDDFMGPRRGQVIRVTLSSRRNLFQYEQNYGWLLGGKFYLCDNGSLKKSPLGASGLFWRRLSVGDRVSADHYARILAELEKSETQLYQTVLAIRNDDPNIDYAGKPTWAVYDLEKDPQDVCFQLSGGSLWGYFRSNIAPIPKEMIASAFQSAHERAASRPAK